MQALLNLENGFDFHRDVAGERPHAHGTARADAVLASEDVGKQFAATVDHLRMIREFRGAVDHAEHFDDALDAVKAAEVFAQGRQDGEADLARGRFPASQVHVCAHPAEDQGFVGLKGAVAGDIGHVAGDDQRFVNRDRFGGRRQFEVQFFDARFSTHGNVEFYIVRMAADSFGWSV